MLHVAAGTRPFPHLVACSNASLILSGVGSGRRGAELGLKARGAIMEWQSMQPHHCSRLAHERLANISTNALSNDASRSARSLMASPSGTDQTSNPVCGLGDLWLGVGFCGLPPIVDALLTQRAADGLKVVYARRHVSRPRSRCPERSIPIRC